MTSGSFDNSPALPASWPPFSIWSALFISRPRVFDQVETAALTAESLWAWKQRSPRGAQTDWVFASPHTKGRQPYWPGTLWRYYGKPALKRAGVTKQVSFHTFRHTFETLLNADGENSKVVQELLCHASLKVTTDVLHAGSRSAEAGGAEQFGQTGSKGSNVEGQARLSGSNWITNENGGFSEVLYFVGVPPKFELEPPPALASDARFTASELSVPRSRRRNALTLRVFPCAYVLPSLYGTPSPRTSAALPRQAWSEFARKARPRPAGAKGRAQTGSGAVSFPQRCIVEIGLLVVCCGPVFGRAFFARLIS